MLCAAALVALGGQGVAAKRPSLAGRQLDVKPIVDVSAVVGVPSCANALNELGTVVGVRRQFGIPYGFSWSVSGGLVTLEPDTTALAVNDLGEMAGYGDVTGTGLDARVWTGAGTANIAVGVAYSLNNRGEVVGFHLPPVGDPPINHGFRWTAIGGLMDVESLSGVTPPWSYFAPLSITRFIRADGVMAGERGGLAVIWLPNGQFATLGSGVANSVNDSGVAAGGTSLSSGRPAVWRNGVPTIITDATGEAVDINAAGYVVGWMSVGGESHGFVWHADRGLWDLGPGQARNIDELGTIAGCRGVDDESRATLWQARMTAADYLVGFESLARRLLADVDPDATVVVFRQIDLAQQALDRGRADVAARHLQHAVKKIGDLAKSGVLPPEWAALLERAGQRIAAAL
jgi:hypothetical protein